ncbi:ADP-ribosylation factor-like protein 6-interacting protein 4 [Oscarella lobularis]|uniref:ADP-ribosylation factor-like protein 6-interacting protein 4 n=1 Tax=Oscarella lobularis TaxID=121494 RepID=UPI003313850C
MGKRKRKRSTEIEDSDSSDSSLSSENDDAKAKKRKSETKKTKKRKKEKKKKKKEKKKKKRIEKHAEAHPIEPTKTPRGPMTKEQWEKEESVIRRVYDPETGRNRLVKGSGEILEEIVSRDRHLQINKQATQGDGLSFQYHAGLIRKS